MNEVGLYSFVDGLTCLSCYKLTVYMTLYVLHVWSWWIVCLYIFCNNYQEFRSQSQNC